MDGKTVVGVDKECLQLILIQLLEIQLDRFK